MAALPYPMPDNEAYRLEVLRSCAILDSSPEQEYDDLLALTARICAAPLASITLIDEARQWFKSRIGFTTTETSRDISLCAHTICQRDLLIVPDASRDHRFNTYANVVGDPHIRFYAGAPLVTHDGAALGSLCVLDRQPRELNEDQLRALRVLSRQLVNALELRRLVHAQSGMIGRLEHNRRNLENARVAAETATREKSRFLAAMSHEIRTPLNAIIGMTTVLADADLKPAERECAETIRSSGEILLSLVNDVLDLSKIESGHLHLERVPFALSTAVRRVLDCVRGNAQLKNIALTTALDPALPDRVMGDVTRVQQILLNLVANAIKFTAQGSVSVAARLAEGSTPDQPVVQFSVTDTGIGIAPERLRLLFHDYAQAEPSTARHYGGTGLGLSISKRLVELHGGSIWVDSVPGKGSTFHFTLRLTAADDQTSAGKGTALDASFAGKYPLEVLVADDNPVNLKVAELFTARLGYKPTFVTDGLQVVEHVRARPVDLILMDMEMPGLDGLQATQRIRRDLPLGRQPRIAALTAHVVAGDSQRFITAGMDDYLAKPIRLDALAAVLHRAHAHRTA